MNMSKSIKCGRVLHGLDRFKPDAQCVNCDLADAYKKFLKNEDGSSYGK